MIRGIHFRPFFDADAGGGAGDVLPVDAPEAPITFTPEQQEMLNRQIASAKRAERERAKKALLEEMGISDPAEVKRLLEVQRQREESEKTELQRAQERLAETERRAQETTTRVQRALLMNAIEAAASVQGFNDPKDAHRFLDMSQFTVDLDSGTVDGVADALKKLAKDKDYLIKRPAAQAPDINSGARSQTATPTLDELLERKRKSGLYSGL